jgi:hypothetical protein
MAIPTKWYREEFKDQEDKLEDRTAFEKRRNLADGVLSSRFYDYTDRAPAAVKEVGRTKYYVATELDAFYDSIEGHNKPRTTAERLAAEVARREGTVADFTARVEKKQGELEALVRKLGYHQNKLKNAQAELEVERRGMAPSNA